MACGGCRRNKKNTKNSIKFLQKTRIKLIKNSISSIELTNRKKKCGKCPFNTSSGLTGRCKKGNRMISRIINDPNFKCPIRRF